MPSEIPVKLGSKSYKIQIAPGNLDTLGVRAASLGLVKKDLPQGDSPQKCLIVSNEKIFQLYGQRAVKSLSEAGFQVETCLVNEGEEYKNADSIDKIYHTASSANLERSSTMIALGGGVIGDMTGFAAATWVRGVNFIQVPTTLLAMVDASIGGKTGINYGERKNSIGAFYQPKLVLIDPEVLKTLIADEFQAGMAEVIKYGVIKDKYLFKQLEAHSHLDSLSCIPQELLTKIVERSCQAKAKVVSKDEREAGLRAILNYGHTIGHAIESLTNYTLSHGRAVGIGMVAAGAIAVRLGLWSEKALQRQNALIRKAGLGTLLPEGKDTDEDIEEIIRKLATDKKVKNGKVEFILPTKIGKVVITNQVPDAVIREVLREMRPI